MSDHDDQSTLDYLERLAIPETADNRGSALTLDVLPDEALELFADVIEAWGLTSADGRALATFRADRKTQASEETVEDRLARARAEGEAERWGNGPLIVDRRKP